jgi:hypothetical protein
MQTTQTPSTFLTLGREMLAGANLQPSGFHNTAGEEVYTDVAAREERKVRVRAEFIHSPRGRFCAAVDELETHGCYGEEVYKLRSLYNSRITALNGPVADPAAVGAAVLILTGIRTQAATAGVEALAELLIGAEPALMAAE